MPDTLDATGLTVKSTTETINDLVSALQLIYGPDINVSPNTPDGQLINIFAQACSDMRELLVGVYNSFSPANAYGTLLDQRVALNGLARRQGTFTLTDVLVTVNQALTLPGLDLDINDPDGAGFTIKDDTGIEFILVATHVFSGAGSATLSFRSKAIGAIQTTPNTITNQVTQVLGVTTVNNPAVATYLGVDEETDAQLRTRHSRSFALAATGGTDAVEAALKAAPAVLDAYVLENFTDALVGVIPAHTIWAIVRGGAAADIAAAIYAKKGSGCGMKGAVSYTITRPNGNGFVAAWDTAIAQALYVKFTIQGRVAGQTFDTAYLAAQLAAALSYNLGQSPTVGDIVNAMLVISPLGYLTIMGVSTDGVTYAEIVTPSDALHYFTLTAAHVAILT